MKIIPISPPILGLNTVNPYVDFESGYARELTNYFMSNGALKMRPNVGYNYISSSASTIFHHSGRYGINTDGDIYDFGLNTTSTSIGGTTQRRAGVYAKHKTLDLVFGGQEPRNVDNPFTAWTFTTTDITDTEILDGCSHNGRLIVCDEDTLAYSTRNATMGAMEGYFSLSDFLEGQSITRIFSLTAFPGDSTQNLLFIFADGGKVLIYSGLYPASTSWQLIGNYNMTPPAAGGLCFVEKDDDIYVGGWYYAYKARDLLNGGSSFAYENRISKQIENLWQNQNWYFDYSNETPHAFYLDKDYTNGVTYDLIIFQCSSIDVDYAANQYHNEVVYLVYNRTYNHWSIWGMTPVYAPVRQISSIATGTSPAGGISYVGYTPEVQDYYSSSGSATTENIITSWKTPYTSPYQGRLQKLNAIRPNFRNTASGYFYKIRAITDYSDLNFRYGFYTQPNSTTVTNPGKYQDTSLDLVANTYGHYQSYRPLGISGEGISFQFSQARKTGSSDAHVHEIYAATAYISDGGVLIV